MVNRTGLQHVWSRFGSRDYVLLWHIGGMYVVVSDVAVTGG